MSRKYFGSWNNLLKEVGHQIKVLQKPTLPNKDSLELYYLLGILFTDGYIYFNQKKYCRVAFFTSESDEKIFLLKLIKKLFNYNSPTRSKTHGFAKKPNYEIYINSKKVCEFFHSLGMPYGAKSCILEIPLFMFNLREEKIINFLRGVFDGDGSIIFSNYVEVFKISSGSKKFIQGLSGLFEKIGIEGLRVVQERENLWELKLTRRKEIRKIFEKFYRRQKYFYPRKKIKWQKRYI